MEESEVFETVSWPRISANELVHMSKSFKVRNFTDLAKRIKIGANDVVH